ncbi:cobalt ABC transporter ATP-binding protein [Denitrobacterium detoxificans]|nr:cobalt ABC transporter ATP-binding protein [Denitrobacterium detoxificans]
MVDFQEATFTYDGERLVLNGIDLAIQEGEFIAILGGNGSGKSTLAKHVNALLAPDSGSVHVLGRATSDAQETYFIRSKAGMVFQNPDDQLVASLIEDDVAFGPENLGIPNPELRERVTQALERVGLQGFELRETTALSGGQKQRVAIAGVLAMQPRILILDEASAMLDPRGRAGLLRVAHELNDEGMTVIMITHFMEEAAQADRVFVMEAGTVALSGTPSQVFSQIDKLAHLHLDTPFAAHMSLLLQKRGVPVPVCMSEEELAREVRALLAGEGGQA